MSSLCNRLEWTHHANTLTSRVCIRLGRMASRISTVNAPLTPCNGNVEKQSLANRCSQYSLGRSRWKCAWCTQCKGLTRASAATDCPTNTHNSCSKCTQCKHFPEHLQQWAVLSHCYLLLVTALVNVSLAYQVTRSSVTLGLTRSPAVAGCPTTPSDTTKECPCKLCKDSPGQVIAVVGCPTSLLDTSDSPRKPCKDSPGHQLCKGSLGHQQWIVVLPHYWTPPVTAPVQQLSRSSAMSGLTRSSAMSGLTRSSAVAGCPTSPLDTTKEGPCELCKASPGHHLYKDSPGHRQWQDVLPCCWPPPSCQVALACHAGQRSRPGLPWFHWPLLCQTGSETDIEGGCVHILNRLLWDVIQTAVFDYSTGTSFLM